MAQPPMEMPGGFVALAPTLKSPPASVPRAGWCWVEGIFSLALWVYSAASGWRTGGICVDAQVKQPVLHSANMLFLLLFQLAVTRDTAEDPGDLHIRGQRSHQTRSSLLLLSASAVTKTFERPGANPSPVEQISRKAVCQTCLPGRFIKIGHDPTLVPF